LSGSHFKAVEVTYLDNTLLFKVTMNQESRDLVLLTFLSIVPTTPSLVKLYRPGRFQVLHPQGQLWVRAGIELSERGLQLKIWYTNWSLYLKVCYDPLLEMSFNYVFIL
jgi:hypothetical protein